MSKTNYLTISVGHPDFSPGGAETAAYNMHAFYGRADDSGTCAFLARKRSTGSGAISLYRENEYLWDAAMEDYFTFERNDYGKYGARLAAFLAVLRPAVVHVHHYIHLGLGVLAIIRKTLPECKLIFTLHEYHAICHRYGQMIKNGTDKLCYKSSPAECAQCFPEIRESMFWVREQTFKHYFGYVDEFHAPSEFLKSRYVDWGLDEAKIRVRENEQLRFERLPPRPLAKGETRNRFAFFGQITPFKGVDLLLEALQSMGKERRASLRVEINGANFEQWEDAFKKKVRDLAEPLMEEGCLRWVGSYEQSELPSRMAKIDWVVIPSIWWENSPMVIQEAKNLGRKLLVADIGGMAEKVKPGVDGRHFQARNPLDLADVMLECAKEV